MAGLLALMLLTDARRAARTGPDGALVPLAEQDRTRWDAAAIAEGVALVTARWPTAPVGPYQLQAAIAAVHDEAPRAAGHRLAADRSRSTGCWTLIAPEPDGHPQPGRRGRHGATARAPGSTCSAALDADERTGRPPPARRRARRTCSSWPATRGAARAAYLAAARRTTSLPEQRYLDGKAASLAAVADRTESL